MRIAMLTTDNREHHRRYDVASPYFGPAIEAVLQGLSGRSELEVHVISCTQQPMRSPEKLADNVWFHLLHVPKIGWLRTAYQGCIRAVRRKVRELQPDIVHGQGTERDCAISAAFSGFPNVLTIHGNMRSIAAITEAPPLSYNWCAARLERLTLPRTWGVLCNSAFTRSQAQRLARRTWDIPNGLRRQFFETPLDDSHYPKPTILNIGTVAKHKRQIELLEIAQGLHKDGHSFELQFIGDAPDNKYTDAFFARLKSAERSGFARHLEPKTLCELIKAIDASSALVHIPSAESFGLVVGEALARNLKFFGTNVGGIPDVAGGVEGAELFPLGDDEALGKTIGKWLRDGCPRPRCAAVEMKTRYHPEVIAEQHAKVYGGLLKKTLGGVR
jgi:glycosyltransferase involved in cell wall biosynthesis